MKNKKATFFLYLIVITFFIIICFDFFDKKFNTHDILVEFHGLIFDLVIFGLLLTIYDSIKSKQEKITRYRDEIQDYAGFENDMVKFRNRGLIKKLINLNANKIDLSFCSIKNCPYTKEMIDWNFGYAKLFNSYFINCDLSSSEFYMTELYDSDFIKADLTGCYFGTTILDNCNFNKCKMNGVKFDFAYVSDKDWLKKIQQNNNIGCEKLLERYIVLTNSVSIDSKKYFQIIDKSNNRTLAIDRKKQINENLKRPNKKIESKKIMI